MRKPGGNQRPDWRLAVVIGAGGMGMAAARRLSQRQRLLIADLDGARAEAAAAQLQSEGADAAGLACDVTRLGDVRRLAETVARTGPLRVLAHVAGLSPSMGSFDQIVDVNLAGPAHVAAALLPLAGPGTAAILISSLAAHNFRPPEAVEAVLRSPEDPGLVETLRAAVGPDNATPQSAYALSKFGLMAYCRRQATAWGERGARIVSLSPGMIATPMGAREFEQSPRKLQLFQRTPLQREGTMLEIADAIEFLASDRASFISGTDLLVDGGLASALSSD